jgi:hypothetical protein
VAKALSSFIAVAGSIAALAASGVGAQVKASSDAAPSPKWQVDWGEFRCLLLRTIPGDKPITLAVSASPAKASPQLLLVSKSWKANSIDRSGDVTVGLVPTGQPIAARATIQSFGSAGRSISVDGLPPDMLDRIARSTGLTLSSKNKVITSISFNDAKEAVVALRECNGELLRSWGIDPAQQKQLKTPAHWEPPPVKGHVMDISDIPASNVRQRSWGEAVVVFDVAADGSTSGCKVITATDNRDRRVACEYLTKRGKYVPAIGLDGGPVPSRNVESFERIEVQAVTVN